MQECVNPSLPAAGVVIPGTWSDLSQNIPINMNCGCLQCKIIVWQAFEPHWCPRLATGHSQSCTCLRTKVWQVAAAVALKEAKKEGSQPFPWYFQVAF